MSMPGDVVRIRLSARTKEDAPAKRPPYVIAMAFLTVSYLVFELGFNARLLDVTGGYATPEQVHSIESWGRLISGVAATLAAWGMLFAAAHRKGWTGLRLGIFLAMSAAVAMPTVYLGQKAIIDRIVDGSEGAMRRSASYLRAVSGALLTEAVTLDGIDLSADEMSKPEGKSFLALFPFIALSTKDLDAKSEAVLRDVLRSMAARRLGTAPEAYNRAFVPSAREVRDSYNEYVAGVNAHARAIEDVGRKQARAWNDYQSDLRSRGRNLRPDNVPRSHWENVRQQLAKKGLDLPKGWNPADKATFDAAVAAKVRKDADAEFRSRTTKLAGKPLPLGLGLAEFVDHETVQKRWRTALKAPDGVRLSFAMGLESYRDRVYRPQVDKWVTEEMRTLMSPAEKYADGGALEKQGKAAMTSLVVPPVALAFSLLGALVHMFKASSYLFRLALPGVRVRGVAILACMVAVAAAPFLLPNEVSRSRAFSYFEAQSAETFTPPAAWAARWVIQAQPYFHPLNESIRKKVLRDYGFGYEPIPANGKESAT